MVSQIIVTVDTYNAGGTTIIGDMDCLLEYNIISPIREQ
jgi:hypothetical protein